MIQADKSTRYADIFPYKWLGGPFLGTACGRIRFVFKVIGGCNPEALMPDQLTVFADMIAGFCNRTLPVWDHLQTFVMVSPDVRPVLDEHMAQVVTQSDFVRELEKERCRGFIHRAQNGQCAALETYICAGFDPYIERRQGLLGYLRPDLPGLLHWQEVHPPEGDSLAPQVILSGALERLAQIESFLTTAGLEVQMMDGPQLRHLLQQAQYPAYSLTGHTSDALPIGRYTFLDDCVIQTIGNRHLGQSEQRTYYTCLVPRTFAQVTCAGMLVPYISEGNFTRLSISTARPSDTANQMHISIKKNLGELANAFQAMIGRGQSMASSVQQGDLQYTEQRIFQDKTNIVQCGIIVVVAAPDRENLQYAVKQTCDRWRSLFQMELEVGRKWQEDLWFASLPAAPVPPPESVRNRCFPENAADFMLPVLPWQGSPKKNFLIANRWRQVIGYDLFNFTSCHGILGGRTGEGKSFQALDLYLQAAAVGCRGVILDKMGSYYFLFKHVLGGMARTMQPGTFTINPFEFYLGEGQDLRTATVPPSRIEALKACFATVLGLQRDTNGNIRALLTKAISLTYQRILPTGRYPIISDLIDTLRLFLEGQGFQECEIEFTSQSFKELVSSTLVSLFEFNTENSMLKLCFNGQSSERFFEHDHIYFDLAPLGKGTMTQRLVAQLLATSIDEWVQTVPKRTLIIFEEIWSDVTDNPEMVNLMKNSVRAYRRYGVRVFFVTQSFGDILDSEYARDLFEQTRVRIALKQDNFHKSAQDLKANPIALATINTLETVKGDFSELFFFWDNDRSAVVNFSTPMRYWVATTDELDTPWRNYLVNELKMDAREAIVRLARTFPNGVHDATLLDKFKAGEFDLAPYGEPDPTPPAPETPPPGELQHVY
ncbi:type IV secretory pathway, VirB4 component [Gloeobacter kilaueensis]|uniref:Type IV secretory pathway, VirB4 component n=1 Tax=Gloeobacter kilaueensis (strain ATCC BAA-2537 / CCAP 1431/1 / ULC 316 / JS1) TaxID=1183438 RepID=U5QGF9_GLOK1|nr:type IV secretory pathway, VirB4 component [Gloeobacter kilaueensis]AGY58006.1 type IV secretory pathway, VirB4 component [Gloeobacter kilaueensis JS1]